MALTEKQKEKRRAGERRRYALNPEKFRNKNQRYHQNNKEKISLRKKLWAIANPEKVNKSQRENPEHHNEYIKQYRKKHPEKFTAYARKQNYGVTQEWFDNTFKEQDGKCAICFNEMKKPSVDHNHTTDKVRGILCHPCNVMLGYAHEDPIRLASAIQYLEKYKEENNGSVPV